MEKVTHKFELSEGVNPLALAEKYDAPLYVYDGAIIERQFNRLNKAFKVPKLILNYACKALTNISILKFLRQLGAGLDCVSVQEIKMGLLAGFQPNEIIYTPSGVSFAEIDAAIELGVRINVDNLPLLEYIGKKATKIPVCIRINPHIKAGGNDKISVGSVNSKFGISYQQIPYIKQLVTAYDIKVDGLHMHTGSDIKDVDVFMQGAEILLTLAMDFPDLDFIDLGSGFKVAYQKNDKITDIDELGVKMSERFNRFCQAYGKDLTLIFEPGKFLVSESGYFLVRVNVVKQTTAKLFIGVDSGLNHLIRPMFYDSHHHIVNVSNPKGEKKLYDVVGYICETDTFAENRSIEETKAGDLLAFFNAGAYCFSMASNYNSRFRPAEIFVYNGVDYLVRKRETFEDLMLNQIEVNVMPGADKLELPELAILDLEQKKLEK
ncbi:MAG: diaminopimelate decarboxylase [Saprospiraceae bacterium]